MSHPDTSVNRKRSRPLFDEPTGRKARRSTSESAEGGEPSMLYPALESQIKHVPPDVVSSKWVNLSNTSQEQVRRLLRAVQRPVVARYRDDSKRAEAQLAIHSFIETLERKLPRFPFPPNTKDAHFDYEKLLDSNRSLEAQLTPAIHSIGLLREAIQKEEALLDAEKLRLETLQESSRIEESLRKRQAKKTHSLYQLGSNTEPREDGPNAIGLLNKSHRDLSLDKITDPDLEPVLQRLREKLTALDDGVEYAEALGDALSRTQIAMDDLLYERLTDPEYRRISQPTLSADDLPT